MGCPAATSSTPSSRDLPRGGFRSGFWGIVRIEPRAGRSDCELLLRARLDDGSEAVAELGHIPLRGARASARCGAPATGGGTARRHLHGHLRAAARPLPPPARLDPRADPPQLGLRDERRLLEPRSASPRCRRIVGATRASSSRARRAASASTRNFERALSLAPADAEFVAMADQDDLWHPDKLDDAARRARRRQARLQRRAHRRPRRRLRLRHLLGRAAQQPHRPVVAPDGQLGDRRRLAVPRASCSTGRCPSRRASSPLPRPLGGPHRAGHWATSRSSTARSTTTSSTAGAVLGHAARTACRRCATGSARCGARPRDRVRRWRLHYFVDVCRLLQFATVLQMRCGDRMAAGKRRALDRFVRGRALAARRWAGSRARAARELVGRPETLGAELALCFGFAWRHAAWSASTRERRAPAAAPADRRAPARRRCGRRPASGHPQVPRSARSRRRSPRSSWRSREDAPTRVNLLVPTIDLDALLRRLHREAQPGAPAGRARRRACGVVTVDPSARSRATWRQRSSPTAASPALFDRVEVAFAREAARLEVSRDGPLRRHDLVDRPHRRTGRVRVSSAASASST